MAADLLVLILDVNPFSWAASTPTMSTSSTASSVTASNGAVGGVATAFGSMVSQSLAFVNAFMMLNRSNRIAVIATHPKHRLGYYFATL
jgi:hypothetical protein